MTAPTKICVPVTPESLPVLLERLGLKPQPDAFKYCDERWVVYGDGKGVGMAHWATKPIIGDDAFTLTTPNQFVETVAAIWPVE
jgi:hypothetical protein